MSDTKGNEKVRAMTFKKTVLAYLTGWVIAQSIFNRVWHRIMRNAIEADQDELFARVGGIVADKVFERADAEPDSKLTELFKHGR